MLIAPAYATETTATTEVPGAAPLGAPAATGSAVAWNMGLILILVVMFYFLLIRPQQKRFQEHKAMLDALKKGDRVITAGGLIGTIDKLTDGSDEVVVDLGNGMKVTALRSTIQTKAEK
jgi:preprotein translocase subunit YajC